MTSSPTAAPAPAWATEWCEVVAQLMEWRATSDGTERCGNGIGVCNAPSHHKVPWKAFFDRMVLYSEGSRVGLRVGRDGEEARGDEVEVAT